MSMLEQILGLFVAALILAAGARRVGAPYPVFLALGGALLALLPGVLSFSFPPELALALFVAPVLLDAAYDASPQRSQGQLGAGDQLGCIRGRIHDRRCRRRRPYAHTGDAMGSGDSARRGRGSARRGGGHCRAPPVATAPSHSYNSRRRKPAE